MKEGQLEFRANCSSGINLMFLGAIALFAGLVQRSAGALALGAVMLTAPLVVYFLLKRSVASLVLRQTAPDAAFEGDVVEVRVRLHNGSSLPLFFPRFSEVFGPEFGAQKDLLFPDRVQPGETVVRRYQGTCASWRGVYDYGPTAVRVSDPFGWFEIRQLLKSDTRIKVYPRIDQLGWRDDLGTAAERHRQRISASGPGQSHEFWSVRDYRPGDPRQHVHWRLTARRGFPVVRETTRETGGDVAFILDPCRRGLVGSGRHSSFEQAIRITASMGLHALRHGRCVRLMAGGEPAAELPPGTGPRHALALLDALVGLKATREEDLPDLLPDLLARAGAGATLVITLSPYLFGRADVPTRLGDARRAGCRVIAIVFGADPGEHGAGAVTTELARFRSALVSRGVEVHVVEYDDVHESALREAVS